MTPKEIEATIERLRNYPAGTVGEHWGRGPLDVSSVEEVKVSVGVFREYG